MNGGNERLPLITPLDTPRFPVGTRFIRMGQKREQTVVDYLVTRNMAGEIVKARYLCVHDFMGQRVTDADINGTTIARSEILHLPS